MKKISTYEFHKNNNYPSREEMQEQKIVYNKGYFKKYDTKLGYLLGSTIVNIQDVMKYDLHL